MGLANGVAEEATFVVAAEGVGVGVAAVGPLEKNEEKLISERIKSFKLQQSFASFVGS